MSIAIAPALIELEPGTERVLALDPGGITGYAWTEDRQVHHEQSGCWNLGRIDDAAERFDYLQGKLDVSCPTHIAYEDPMGLRGMAAVWFYGYRAVVFAWAQRNGASLALVNQNTLKEFATGSGAARKEQMKEALERRLGLKLAEEFDDNQVDALWVLAWGIHEGFALDVPYSRDCTDGEEDNG